MSKIKQNRIQDPQNHTNYSIFSVYGKQLLKQYITTYNIQYGGDNKSAHITDKCYKPLYGDKNSVTNVIEKGCDIKHYSKKHIYPESIAFALSKGLDKDLSEQAKKQAITKQKAEAVQIAMKVVKYIKHDLKIYIDTNKLIKNNKFITVLGPLEYIIGFFIKFLDKQSIPLFKHFNVLAVEGDEWSTDLNRDFIDCAIKIGNDFHFENANSECPIILINKGSNLLKTKHIPHLRVTHCEMRWIEDLITNNTTDTIKYEWITYEIPYEDKSHKKDIIYIHILVDVNLKSNST